MSDSCSHGKSLGDLIAPGKPLLVTSGSSTGAVMMVKDECYKKGIEPVVLDVDLMDAHIFSAEVASIPKSTILIIGEARRALPEVFEVVKEVMKDPDRTVVVADARSKNGIDPHLFTSLGGHTASF